MADFTIYAVIDHLGPRIFVVAVIAINTNVAPTGSGELDFTTGYCSSRPSAEAERDHLIAQLRQVIESRGDRITNVQHG